MNDIINKWKLNKGMLAKKMNMPLGTFTNKLNPNHSTKFKTDEEVKLKMILKEMCDEISSAIDIDFNDALGILIKKK